MPEKNGRPHFPYVLFDLGNTLLYFDDDFSTVVEASFRTAAAALARLGYRLDEEAFAQAHSALARSYYQRRNEDLVEYTSETVLREILREHSYPDPRPEDLAKVIQDMYAVSQAHWRLESDTVPVLQALRASGRKLGVVSNAADDSDVQTLVDNAGLRSYFDFILTSAGFGYRKPSPRIFRQALSYWNASPEQAVMIGDTVAADIAGANGVGIASVWISRRADRAENQMALGAFPPGAIIEALSDLPGLLENWPGVNETTRFSGKNS